MQTVENRECIFTLDEGTKAKSADASACSRCMRGDYAKARTAGVDRHEQDFADTNKARICHWGTDGTGQPRE